MPNSQTQIGYLLDLYSNGIQYSPSSQFLERLHQRKRPPLNDILPLFAIQNPTEDLRYTEIEVEEISRRFNPHAHILKRSKATKVAFNSAVTLKKLTDSYYAHFSCHGSFNSENPLNSGLVFAGVLEPPQPPLVRGEQEVEAESDTKILSEAPQTLSESPQPPLVRGEQEVEAEPPQPPLVRGEQEVEAEPPQPPLVRGEQEVEAESDTKILSEAPQTLSNPPQPPLVRGEQEVEAESDTKILSEASQTLSDPPQPPLVRGEQEVEAESDTKILSEAPQTLSNPPSPP